MRFILLAVFGLWGTAAHTTAAPPPPVQAFLERHCLDCHDTESAKGGLDLTSLPLDPAEPGAHRRWVRVFDRVTAGEMPPAKEPRPKPEVQKIFLSNLGTVLRDHHAQQRGTVLRRLNRIEYQNTVNQLLGVESDVADLLPEDGKLQGFDTVGEALSVSSVQMQRYLDAAQSALQSALLQDERPQPIEARLTLDSERNRGNFERHWLMAPDGAVVIFDDGVFPTTQLPNFRAPADGQYTIEITASAYQSAEPVVFALVTLNPEVRGENAISGFFEAPPKVPATVSTSVRLRAGEALKIAPQNLTGPSGRSPEKDGPTRYAGQGLALKEVVVRGPVVADWPPLGQSMLLGNVRLKRVTRDPQPERRGRPAVLKFKAETDDPTGEARRNLTAFLQAAFRRPVTEADVIPYLTLFESEFTRTHDYLDAIQSAAIAALCSPDFLFLIEPAGRLPGQTLASRLSYLLTRGPPDAALLTAAAQGQLDDPAHLKAQINRLLDHPTHGRFIQDFTDGWLNLRDIDFTTPDRTLYPEFDDLLRDSMLRETRGFITELIRSNLPASTLIQSDFALLNGRLARHYGVPGVFGLDLRKVPLPPDSKRGGLLTHASVLKVSANGTNTSPVIRGVWVMSRLLGTELPPPPPGIGAVEPDIRGATTLRQQLDKHRDSTTCNACHRIIDPPGFAMENYDVIGGWRHRFRTLESGERPPTQINGRRVRYRLGPPVDATGQLPNGQKFTNMPEFQRLLVQQQDQVARCFVEKFLTFATGREMGFSDRDEITRIVESTKPSRHGLRDLLHASLQSDIFRSK